MNPKQYFVIDTNVLVSAVLFKNSKARQTLDKAQNIDQDLLILNVFQNVKIITIEEFINLD
jgi:predicted nucleic acid-binding protein